MRPDGRAASDMRQIMIEKNYLMHPEGSVLVSFGDTKVICTASVEDRVPPFMRGQGKGWITAEYAMLPRATGQRTIRESSKGKVSGRTMEIQRLIGRALRAVVDLDALGERTVWIDCDVIQADGGTRTASISGAFAAMSLAIEKLAQEKELPLFPVKDFLAAVSAGINSGGEPILDLNYAEDSTADVDMNIVMTGKGEFVELQGTGEEASFTHQELLDMLSIGRAGIERIIDEQKSILGEELTARIVSDVKS
ncbi:ribonuclease PH [Jeotgalibacillus haloalkalitolerans]|uniref:Ribonuclease PH n=1 Tax=Jeotgalibacillus haloalkalitolerans TaxID=3104292 RepID=A0ABU5KMT4_9BACL|nr:ribonuclease PH [Jeotgalibacillus sp. HH7-29]MDZ5712393.1 ribonuclease PH [Jeotgalibacillus sp. HH7-29]